jgi:hypothetical protein
MNPVEDQKTCPAGHIRITLVIPSFRKGIPSYEYHLWDDLRVCLTSVEAYASDPPDSPRNFLVDTIVGWDGPREPNRMPADSYVTFLERPKGLSGTAAFNWCVEQAKTERIIMLNDDAVLHPSTLKLLMEDWNQLAQTPDLKMGLLGCRSNFVAGAGNIRQPNGGALGGIAYTSEERVLPVDTVFPVCAMVNKSAYLEAGGLQPALNWYSDNLLCFDLKKSGHSHFVSRAYVHHIGMRGSVSDAGLSMAEENAKGLAWLKANRDDYYRVVTGQRST